MAGYSGTPLVKKLGIKPGNKILLIRPPAGYRSLLDGLPEDVQFVATPKAATDVVHAFCTKRSELKRTLETLRRGLAATAAVWVSWPKKASGVNTDITEDAIRAAALPLGLVDVKVCAVDEVWSGLKLVVRKELR